MNPVNYGSTWNTSLFYDLGNIIGTETRALWLIGATEFSQGDGDRVFGLDCWSPNINIARDPRWGRNQEVASEDPLINGDFGAWYTKGLQYPTDGDPDHIKVVVTLKHWDAYSLEDSDGSTRYNFNAVVSNAALQGTYFPAFKKSVLFGNAKGVMCSYNALNGVPTCASSFLTQVLRDTWGFDGYVTSDSGALENIANDHHYTNSTIYSVPVALRDGQTDVCSGSVYSGSLLAALNASLIAREDIDLALYHTLKLRFELGLFDPIENQPYWNVPPNQIGTARSSELNLLATQSSMVLLKNNGVLPFPLGKNIVIIGPHGNASAAMVGNYLGQICDDSSLNCVVSPYLALQSMNVGGSVTWVQGCALNSTDYSGFAAAIAAAQQADLVVLALGIDGTFENEMKDRVNIDLPLIQHQLAGNISNVGKPTAVVLIHGGVVDISPELANPNIGGIFTAGYPGFLGGTAIAQTILGMNPHLGGKTAVTYYPASFVNEIMMSEMELDVGVGRGYRYYTGTPVVPFGYGLAYTNFSTSLITSPTEADSILATEVAASRLLAYSINVTNVGPVTGDEVIQAYFYPMSTPAQASSRLIRQLFDYKRVHLAPGESTVVTFTASTETLRMVAPTGDIVSTPGKFQLKFTNGVYLEHNVMVTVKGEEKVVEYFQTA
jgi:xylan 1,4-beta-xylosidase